MKLMQILSSMSLWMGLILVAGLCTVPVLPQSMNDDVEDVLEDEEEVSVESDDSPGDTTKTADLTNADNNEQEEEESTRIKPSPDAETYLHFIQPRSTEFRAGQLVRLIVGFRNKGLKDFIVDTMDASFRYPQDYSYYIQNFTGRLYEKTVEPFFDGTFEYSFIPSDAFSSRPFGLVVNLNYHDADNNVYQDTVFNATITITEPDEGFDGETFFLYVFLVAMVVLVFVGLHQLFNTYGKKRLISSRPRPQVEMGTQSNKADVDYEWLPDTLLTDINRTSPKSSPKAGKLPKTPPRQRKPRTEGN